MRLKICGIRTQKDLQLCLEADVDAVGFVVEYPTPVPWNIGVSQAQDLIASVPPYTSSVLVTTGSPDTVLSMVDQIRPSVLQLHGDETEEEIRTIVEKSRHVRVVKALRVSVSESTDVDWIVNQAYTYVKCGISALLLDSKTDTMPAGTGVPLNWNTARQVVEAIEIPVILAGGITRENVHQALQIVNPYGIDLISAVETTPGVKDPKKLMAFVEHFRKLQ